MIDRLADDLRAEFPDMRGFSRSNLKYMRQAAASWPGAIGQHAAGQLPWGHIMVLLDKVTDPAERDWEHSRHAVVGASYLIRGLLCSGHGSTEQRGPRPLSVASGACCG